ncbi:MBL fold metallo-hydrolase [Flavilitoribacter nigricans]|uniref:Peptidase n=1 Tax=Flavilitoribacter nigricans (strain ATCC 23147 / DSM 23189 / NBRC 102662 / NCIMB 1420 / SS-2) TaxID=1122177 RepID=A0A2D0NI68_FLAN2|nr:peptidase [Flavilitoribacter nigricans]PHN08118.1 peptidase [Flavilitoribacter nigricans DSM 23189 = NBRC 102662]
MLQSKIKSKEDEDICILVRPDNHPWNYLCDCGDAGGLTVKECQDTRAIFISHTHFDHFCNFDWILRHQLGIAREVIICGPPQIARQVQSRLQSYTWNLIDPEAICYQVREVTDGDRIKVFKLSPPLWELQAEADLTGPVIFADEQFSVEFTVLDHKIPSVAYLFREVDTVKIDMEASNFRAGKWVRVLKEAYEAEDGDRLLEVEGNRMRAAELFHLLFIKKGDTLGVIMDHGADAANHERIQGLFTDCHRVYIESFFQEEDRALAEAHRHSYSVASGKIMRQCRVAEAIPVHFSRKYEPADIERLKAEFEKAYLGD